MSIWRDSQPMARISRKAWSSVRVPVAKPGIVTPMMWLRGRPSASIARAHTSNACVESSPPDTPITSLLDAAGRKALRQALHLDVVDLVAAFVAPCAVRRHIGVALHAAPQGGTGRHVAT